MFLYLLSLAIGKYNNKQIENLDVMDVTSLPFNKLIGIKYSNDPDYLLMLDDCSDYHNHLSTVHASAQFALAEASSGHFLSSEFEITDGIIPVVRRSEIKFRKPVKGKLYSKASYKDDVAKEEIIAALQHKKRISISVGVDLFDESQVLVMRAVFDWVIL